MNSTHLRQLAPMAIKTIKNMKKIPNFGIYGVTVPHCAHWQSLFKDSAETAWYWVYFLSYRSQHTWKLLYFLWPFRWCIICFSIYATSWDMKKMQLKKSTTKNQKWHFYTFLAKYKLLSHQNQLFRVYCIDNNNI